jgi:hypothetical protein
MISSERITHSSSSAFISENKDSYPMGKVQKKILMTNYEPVIVKIRVIRVARPKCTGSQQ